MDKFSIKALLYLKEYLLETFNKLFRVGVNLVLKTMTMCLKTFNIARPYPTIPNKLFGLTSGTCLRFCSPFGLRGREGE